MKSLFKLCLFTLANLIFAYDLYLPQTPSDVLFEFPSNKSGITNINSGSGGGLDLLMMEQCYDHIKNRSLIVGLTTDKDILVLDGN